MNKGFKILIGVMIVSTSIALFWNKIPAIKNAVHFVLDPLAGRLLTTHPDIGMIVITAIITLLLTLVQKYTTDNEALKKIKAEQKILQEQMKEFKDHPDKLLELQKKQFAFFPQTLDITMKPLLYTAAPIILMFRWFNDYFLTNPVKIFGILTWFWAYLIFSIIFSMIFRKMMKLP